MTQNIRLRRARRHPLRILSMLTVALVAASGFTVVSATVSAPAAVAAPLFECSTGATYAVDGKSRQINRIDPQSGVATPNGIFNTPQGHTVNALALPQGGGQYIWAFDRTANTVLRYDAGTETTTSFPGPQNASATIAGAIDPSTGIYYFATGGSRWNLYAFDTSANTLIGQVGTISGLGGNGDMAFDSQGNLLVVSNDSASAPGTFGRVAGPIATTAGSASYSAQVISSTQGDSGQYASMAVVADGSVVIGTAGSTPYLIRVDAETGETLSRTPSRCNSTTWRAAPTRIWSPGRRSFPTGAYSTRISSVST